MTFDRNEAKTLLTQTPYVIFNCQLAQKIGINTSLVLARLCGGQVQYGEEFYLHQERIAKDMSLSVRTVRREIEKLRKMKLLKVIRRKTDNCNFYQINNKAILDITLEVEEQATDSDADSRGTMCPVKSVHNLKHNDALTGDSWGTSCPPKSQRVSHAGDKPSATHETTCPVHDDKLSATHETTCPVQGDRLASYSNIETSIDKEYKNKDRKKHEESNKDPAFAKSADADLCVAGLMGFFSMDGTGNYDGGYYAEFVHDSILLKIQEGFIGHSITNEVDASFEYERWFGIPPVNEPRLGKFYPKKDNVQNLKPLRSEPSISGTSKSIQSGIPVPALRSGGNSESEEKESSSNNHTKNSTPKMRPPDPWSHGTKKPIQSENPKSATRSDGDSEPTPTEMTTEREAMSAEQIEKRDVFRRWWDKMLDDDDDDEE